VTSRKKTRLFSQGGVGEAGSGVCVSSTTCVELPAMVGAMKKPWSAGNADRVHAAANISVAMMISGFPLSIPLEYTSASAQALVCSTAF
jgi:hypothetical protein